MLVAVAPPKISTPAGTSGWLAAGCTGAAQWLKRGGGMALTLEVSASIIRTQYLPPASKAAAASAFAAAPFASLPEGGGAWSSATGSKCSNARLLSASCSLLMPPNTIACPRHAHMVCQAV